MAFLALLAACGAGPETPGSIGFTESAVKGGQTKGWAQWAQNGQHSGSVSVRGQTPSKTLASLVYDPFVPQEQAEFGGDLLGHYQAPLVEGDDVFMEFKTGSYPACNPPGSGQPFPCGSNAWDQLVWNEKRLHWEGGNLVEKWSFKSDWKPEPDFGGLGGWEPVFHAALSDDSLFVPGAGGTVFQLEKGSGKVKRRINPFDSIDALGTFVSGPLSVDDNGNVYYNVLKLAVDPDPNNSNPWGTDVVGSWLVRIDHEGKKVTKASYASLVPGAPRGTDQCHGFLASFPLLWPAPGPYPTYPCGSQRPGVNIAPAIAPNGTVYTVSVAHFNPTYSYLIAVNPDLTPKWAASLRDRLHNGCGVLIPIGNDPGDCGPGAPPGIDPVTGDLPAGWVIDQSSSTPVVAPDGSVLYGAWGLMNQTRGNLMKFNASGQFQASFDFGWDSTPAVFAPKGGDDDDEGNKHYSVAIKDNHYPGSNDCFDPGCPQHGEGPYYITELDENLNVRWKFQNTNTQSCHRNHDGSLSCVSDHPNGFEWCINAPAIDKDGSVYVNSEDGNLYVLGSAGQLKTRMFLKLALGAAYTPLAIGENGRIYTENDGYLFVAGDGH